MLIGPDSIIFVLIERAQYKANGKVYSPGAVEVPCYRANGERTSMLEFMLRESEQLGGKIRRYTSPDEHAFYPDSLPMLVRLARFPNAASTFAHTRR